MAENTLELKPADVQIGSKDEAAWHAIRLNLEKQIDAEERQVLLDKVVLEKVRSLEAEEHAKSQTPS